MEDYDLAVVGGGVAGLSLAHEAGRAGWKVVLLESQPRLGGALHTVRRGDGFWLELGAHTLFNSYGTVVDLLSATGLGNRLLSRRRLPYRLWNDRGIASIPSQLHWAELIRSLVKLPLLHRSDRSVTDYFSAVVGNRNYRDVIGPALDAVVCQPAGDLPADVLFQTKPRRAGVPRSFSLPGGISSFAEGLAATPGIRCITSLTVSAIERHDTFFEIRGGASAWRCRCLALAVPPDQAAFLLATIHPSLAAQLSHIEVARVESLGVVVRNEDTLLEPIAGVIGQHQPFYSLVTRDTLRDGAFRGFTFHFRPRALDESEKLALVRQVIGIRNVRFEGAYFANHTLPSPRLGHAERVRRVDESLGSLPIALTGNYFAGVSIEATVARSRAQWLRLQSL